MGSPVHAAIANGVRNAIRVFVFTSFGCGVIGSAAGIGIMNVGNRWIQCLYAPENASDRPNIGLWAGHILKVLGVILCSAAALLLSASIYPIIGAITFTVFSNSLIAVAAGTIGALASATFSTYCMYRAW